MTRRYPVPRFGTGALVCLLTGLLACSDSVPTAPTVPTVSAARGGGVAPPKVNAAIPSEALQGESLPVRIIGSGYDDGSVVRFLLAGDSTLDMVVHETRYVSPDSLEIDLSVAADAVVALYDIEVMTARGKKGIGTEKFSVKLNGPPPDSIPVTAAFRQSADEAVLTDGVLGDSTGGAYDAVILPIGNLFLDARLDTGRRLCLEFAGQPGAPDVVCDHGYLSTAMPNVSGGLREMPVGTPMTTRAQVTWVKDGYNWSLRFGMDCELNDENANRIDVTHPDADTWTLEGNTARLCGLPTKGKPRVVDFGVFTMPFELTVVRKP